MTYTDALTVAIDLLAEDKRVVFLGQGLKYPGHGMTKHFKNVQQDQIIEMPVAEELQLGMSLGMAITELVPVSVFPRWNFLLLACNQLVNHLDKCGEITADKKLPKVIIKVGVGSDKPLNPGPQHVGDFSEAFASMLSSVIVVQLRDTEQIIPAYKLALDRTDGRSTILVEYMDKY